VPPWRKLLPPPILKADDAVKISGGPFAEFITTVEKISPDRRVWVLLDMMGRTARVAVQPDTLQVVCKRWGEGRGQSCRAACSSDVRFWSCSAAYPTSSRTLFPSNRCAGATGESGGRQPEETAV